MGIERSLQYIQKFLSSGEVKKLVRNSRNPIIRYCNNCLAKKDHDEHKDTEDNTYYFCNTCDTHN